jgi:hypothetical protein
MEARVFSCLGQLQSIYLQLFVRDTREDPTFARVRFECVRQQRGVFFVRVIRNEGPIAVKDESRSNARDEGK